VWLVNACVLLEPDNSINVAVSRFFMKLFRTSDTEVIKFCQYAFNFVIPSA